MRKYPEGAVTDDGEFAEGWKLLPRGDLTGPDGKVYSRGEDGTWVEKQDNAATPPSVTVGDVNDPVKLIAEFDATIRRYIEQNRTLEEKIALLEAHKEKMDRYWANPENRNPSPQQPSIEFSDAKGLFVEKGIEGFEEAIRTPTKDHRLIQLQELSDHYWMTDNILRQVAAQIGRTYHPEGTRAYRRLTGYLKQLGFDLEGAHQEAVKKGLYDARFKDDDDAMHTATQAVGGAWVPTLWSSQMQEYYTIAGNVVPLFEEVPMASDTWEYPITTGRIQTYNAAQSTSAASTPITTSTLPTGKVTFTASKPAGRILWSGELNESSLIPMLPTLRQHGPARLNESWEECIINGVKAGTTHLDSDTSAESADHIRKMWHGLRYHANQQSAEYDATTGSTSYTQTDHTAAQILMGRYGIPRQAGELVWLASLKSWLRMRDFTQQQSADYRPIERVAGITGVVDVVNGHPVVLSEFVRQDLNASGVYDGSTVSYTETVGVNRVQWKRGSRRRETIEVIRIARTDQWEIVFMQRGDFQGMVPTADLASGEALSCVIYAIS